MPPLSNAREKRLAKAKKTEAQKKTTTVASSIKKKPQKKPAPGPGLYLRGLNPQQRFGCGHVGCTHMGPTEEGLIRHMRTCEMRLPLPEKES